MRATGVRIRTLVVSLFLPHLMSCCQSGSMGGGESGSGEPPQLMDMAFVLEDSTPPVTTLFSGETPVKLVLAADFDKLDDDRSQESVERPARVLVRGRDSDRVEIPLEVNTRGKFRLQRRICPDPPLRLNFPDSLASGTLFDGHQKFKLVTHCRRTESFEQNLLEEFLAYRFYNHLTELSFQVQLAEITYLDTSGKRDPHTRMAFLIEDDDAFAARVGGIMVESPSTRPDDFTTDQIGLMYLFQFMVGNVDWGTGASHNMKILLKDGEYHPVPYDFDWAGLVDAPYAEPNHLTEPFHDSVRERVYWGVCLPGIDYADLFRRANEARDAIMTSIRNVSALSDSNATLAERYMDEFYATINDERRASRAIIRACRRWL